MKLATRSKLTPKRRETFLRLLAAGATVTNACAAIGLARRSMYSIRDSDEAFRKAWEDALEVGTEELETECKKRALAGSDVLLMFLLKSRRPEVYRDRVDSRLLIDGRLTLEQMVLNSIKLEPPAATVIESEDPSTHGPVISAPLALVTCEDATERQAWGRFWSALPPDSPEGIDR